MLAYYVELYMCETWRELTFTDEEISLKGNLRLHITNVKLRQCQKKVAKKTAKDGFLILPFAGILINLTTIDFNID
ncbi:MAG: hypothetical protein AMR96_07095 [Candidatus Adiutrix intracellularis]|nr:MAG: hypothetical protein AMR96_07095 [Candidatus Adiutrix intracellularis]